MQYNVYPTYVLFLITWLEDRKVIPTYSDKLTMYTLKTKNKSISDFYKIAKNDDQRKSRVLAFFSYPEIAQILYSLCVRQTLLFSLFRDWTKWNESQLTIPCFFPLPSQCRIYMTANHTILLENQLKPIENWRIWYWCKWETQRKIFYVPETLPKPFSQNELNNLLRDLNLSK